MKNQFISIFVSAGCKYLSSIEWNDGTNNWAISSWKTSAEWNMKIKNLSFGASRLSSQTLRQRDHHHQQQHFYFRSSCSFSRIEFFYALNVSRRLVDYVYFARKNIKISSSQGEWSGKTVTEKWSFLPSWFCFCIFGDDEKSQFTLAAPRLSSQGLIPFSKLFYLSQINSNNHNRNQILVSPNYLQVDPKWFGAL